MISGFNFTSFEKQRMNVPANLFFLRPSSNFIISNRPHASTESVLYYRYIRPLGLVLQFAITHQISIPRKTERVQRMRQNASRVVLFIAEIDRAGERTVKVVNEALSLNGV